MIVPYYLCIALHCIALHCIALLCFALHCIALHCIALHCIALYRTGFATIHTLVFCQAQGMHGLGDDVITLLQRIDELCKHTQLGPLHAMMKPYNVFDLKTVQIPCRVSQLQFTADVNCS